MSTGAESVALDAIAAQCASLRSDIDLVSIEDFSDRSPLNILWFEALQRHGFHVEREVTDHCPRMAFKATWEETLSSIPCNNSRKMEKFRRQLATRFNGALEFAGEDASFQADLDSFVKLHQQRWKRSGWPGLFEDHRYERFFRDALERQHRRGSLILAFYRLEGERRLGIVGFRHHDQFLYYLSGLGDPGKTTHFSPGLVLHILCMEALFNQGIRVYDFLRGTEPYKTDLGGVLVPSWTISAVFPGEESALRNYRWLLLQNSFRRRVRLEWSLFRLTRKEYGLFSGGMKKHISRRWKSVLGDGLTKAKNPEKTVAQAAGRKA